MNILSICPPHLSDVAALPWEIPKSHFSILKYSGIYIKQSTNFKYSIDHEPLSSNSVVNGNRLDTQPKIFRGKQVDTSRDRHSAD